MKKALLFLAAVIATTCTSRCENVLGELFSYQDGAIVGAPGSPWVYNTGTAGTMLVTNGSLELSTGRTEDIAAPLSRILTNTIDVAAYASFRIRVLNPPATNGAYVAHFTASGSLGNHRGRVWLSLTNTSAPGKVRIGIGNTSGSTAATAPWPAELDTNVVYRVVTRIDLSTGTSTLWIDPASEGDPSVTDTTVVGAQGISHFGFRQATGEGVSRVDDLRVGTSFDDVAGTNSPPAISAVASLNIPANSSSGPIPITVGDSETAVESLVLTSTSSNPALIPTNNIVFTGTGANRTVTLTPVSGQEGTSQMAITVTDGSGATATTSFTVTVGAPSISNIANQITPVNAPLHDVPFVVNDAETPNSLIITLSSTNAALLPTQNITVMGSGANRSLSLSPVAGEAGLTLVTVTVSDGTQTASDSFVLTVFPKLGVLLNEPFNYPDGTQIANFTTDWIQHSGISGQTIVFGGKVLINQTNSEDFSREFAPIVGPGSGVILYASFVVNFRNLPGSSGNYFAHYKDDGTLNFRGRIFSSAQGAPAGHFRLGVANAAASVGTNSLHPTFLTTNQTYRVVTRYNVGTAEMTLWVNPASEASPRVTATDVTGATTVFSFALRQDSGIGVFTFDDLKLGTEFVDVSVVIPNYSLRAFRSGSNVVIAWPAAATGFVLQSNPDLNTTNWQDVGQVPVVVGSENVLTNAADIGNLFFRLKQ